MKLLANSLGMTSIVAITGGSTAMFYGVFDQGWVGDMEFRAANSGGKCNVLTEAIAMRFSSRRDGLQTAQIHWVSCDCWHVKADKLAQRKSLSLSSMCCACCASMPINTPEFASVLKTYAVPAAIQKFERCSVALRS